uniref:Uncharacterized protein n=1 Tax=Salmo trutta TaxID=8032 RepID=A0A673XJ19_SALTR
DLQRGSLVWRPAISVLMRAVVLDQSSHFQETLMCYQESIQLLMDVQKGNTHTHSQLGMGDICFTDLLVCPQL